MKELYKINIENYTTTLMHDHSSLDNYFPNKITEPYQAHRTQKNRVIFRQKEVFDDQESYLKNYGNPLATVYKRYAMMVVEDDEKKCSFKLFTGTKKRVFGKSFFSQRKSMMYVTVNKITGDVYFGELRNYNTKKKFQKIFKKNHFHVQFFRKILNTWKNFCTDDGNFKFYNAVTEFRQVLGCRNEVNSINHLLLKNYLVKKKVKFPNNFDTFYYVNLENEFHGENFSPPKLKDIRKNKNKLVDSVMKKNELSGKTLKSALHLCTGTNFILYKLITKIFPKEWVDNDLDLTVRILNFNRYSLEFYTFGNINIDSKLLTTEELKRAFSLFEFVINKSIDISTYFDHFHLYNELKRYGETQIRWKSQNIHTFNQEHFNYSELVDVHKHGSYERIYPEIYYKILEEPILFEKTIFYPKLLNSSEDYNRESNIQSNCVKTYIGKSKSIIVSLRKNTTNSDERATVEYTFSKIKDKIFVHNPQFLGRFNQKLNEEWLVPRTILTTRVDKLVKNGYFKPPQIKKTFQNGKTLQSDSDWNEDGVLNWSLVDLTKYL